MATAPMQLPSLAEPVTFSGADAALFLGSLPRELSDAVCRSLRASTAAAAAAMSSQPANAFFK
jgi:hypothetical protein